MLVVPIKVGIEGRRVHALRRRCVDGCGCRCLRRPRESSDAGRLPAMQLAGEAR